jgi:hypothetical protein
VTRIVVELPAARLREGVVYVDTPGLGSLDTSGAAQTRAYLPRCDLGVVLIDAASTLTEDDLATIQALCDAGIPASVLLSKVDLLAPADRRRALEYVAGHIRSDLGLELPVAAVSIHAEFGELLEKWLESEILPLYDHHAELARQSVARKIGALRFAVEAALKTRLKRSGAAIDAGKLRDLETELRTAAGAIAQARKECLDRAGTLRDCTDGCIGQAAEASIAGGAVKSRLEEAVAERAAQIASAIQAVAHDAGSVLAKAAAALELENRPERDELLEVLRNMPRCDLGSLELAIGAGAAASIFGRRFAAARMERRIRSQAGKQMAAAVGIYARLLESWVRKTFTELQERFDSFAGAYRAHLDRLAANRAGLEDEPSLRDDLAALAAAAPQNQVLLHGPSGN